MDKPLQVKNFPQKLIVAAKMKALQEGITLRKFIIDVLTNAVK